MTLDDQPRDSHGRYIRSQKPNKKKTSLFVWILRIIFLPMWLLYEVTKWGIKSIKAGGSQKIFGIVGMAAAYLVFLVFLISTIAQSNSPEYIAGQTATSVQSTATEKSILSATETQSAIPTATPEPTDTPEPTFTPTQPPAPQVYSGNGDDVIDVESVGPAIVDIDYSGGSNFIVENFDSSGQQIDLLVNTIGAYRGRVEIDFYEGETTGMLQVQASGPWSITITPFLAAELNQVSVPGTYQGAGDDVVLISGSPSIGTFENTGGGNFIVWAIGDSNDLLVNEIAPYSGKVIIPNGTFVMIVKAQNQWSAALE